ncbi:YraN family protein [Pseudorhodobacter sp.]|uniref:YraN family protein n=1 Tax=Pseudorhodobacter sp. TaxID=1934400 RepID=UPI0026496FF1|nr:YraN family protein [Pseudorhodobacter sp.]MDN5786936.1 YraN family protein [Pseudorhodobacter sp.]
MSGLVSYRAGLAAEEAVARHYSDGGRVLAESRWRGSSGEIDLIMREGASVVFVEVKKAATHAEAAIRLTSRQMARIYASASEFLSGEPAGQNTDARFDVALVDACGRIEVLENAFGG